MNTMLSIQKKEKKKNLMNNDCLNRYHHYAASDQGTSAPKSMAGEANFFPAGWALSTPPFKF